MSRDSLAFALDHLKPSDWKTFEEFASAFLISDFPNLRTVGSPSGDRGRDAEIFSPEGDPSVMLQYSVTTDWKTKIPATAKRLNEAFPDTSLLIYVTNQSIGARADELKPKIRKENRLFLDLRDKEWFLERHNSTLQTQSASQFLVEKVLSPISTSRAVINNKPLGLTETEARAALVYLNLQWEDDSREKGLTKLCFEALVRSVLRETDSENRLSREDIHRTVRQILHTHPTDQVDLYTDAALKRLNKRFIRHWKQKDEFCLAHHEALRLRDRLTELANSDKELQKDLTDLTRSTAQRYTKRLSPAQIDTVATRVRRVLERLLLSRGELFVNSIRTGDLELPSDNIQEIVIQDLGDHPDSARVGADLVKILTTALSDLLSNPRGSSQKHLRSLSDAYTLMAFLRETPDVQSAITKMFSEGIVWLDTNIVLPLLAESLLEASARRFQNLLQAAREFGLRLRITPGVLEELERHTNLCLAYARSQSEWKGRVPFLISMFAATGRSLASFGSWIELFRGNKRPADDIADYLESELGISKTDLNTESAPQELRLAVQELFHEAKKKKEQADGIEADPISLRRLVIHDVENYIGVIAQRRQEKSNPFGYSAWWLTLDRTAFGLEKQLRQRLGYQPPSSPVLSPDFLVNYLAFGPRRGRLSKSTEARLPLSLGIGAVDYMPNEILALAEKIRTEMRDLPEHVIRRRVRDELDAARLRLGSLASGGLAKIENELGQTLSESKTKGTRKHRKGN